MPSENGGRQIAQSGSRGDHADARNGAPHEFIRHPVAQPREQKAKVIVLPRRRPGRDDEQQASFDQVRGDEQAADEAYGNPSSWAGMVSNSDGGLNVRRCTGE